MRLAGARRRAQQQRTIAPLRPAIDHVGSRLIGVTDQKILGAERGALGPIKDQLVRLGAYAHHTAGLPHVRPRSLSPTARRPPPADRHPPPSRSGGAPPVICINQSLRQAASESIVNAPVI